MKRLIKLFSLIIILQLFYPLITAVMYLTQTYMQDLTCSAIKILLSPISMQREVYIISIVQYTLVIPKMMAAAVLLNRKI